jgi:hypothetical protein
VETSDALVFAEIDGDNGASIRGAVGVTVRDDSNTINDFYADLVALGGLANALQSAFREIGSSLTVSALDKSIDFLAFASVKLGSRFSQVYIAALERLFLFDFWARGVMLAQGQTPHLTEMARAIDRWVASRCTTSDLAADFKFVAIEKKAAGYERGEEVEERWQSYRESIGFPELETFVEAASRRLQLRQLFPYTSLNAFGFSRCTGYPFTHDTPFVRPVQGQYEVVSASGKVLGRGNADEAADLVVVNLPPNCGPAVAGTAEVLGGAEPDAAAGGGC